MKQFVIVTSLLVAGAAFGQSKKEVNKQLIGEVLLMQQKERVLEQQHDSLSAILNRDKNEIVEKGRVLREQQVKEREFSESVKSRYAKLQRLGHKATADSIITYEQWKLMRTESYSDQQSEMKQLLRQSFTFMKVEDELDTLKGMKLKEQNIFLALKVHEHQRVIELNTDVVQREESACEELVRISARIDSITKQSEQFTQQLDRKNNDLQSQLYKQRMNYIQHGPKGFSEAYADVFADVYFEYFAPKNDPPPMQEKTYEPEDRQYAVEGYDIVPPAEVDPPVSINPEIFEVVEEQAEFPGGVTALRTYLKENLKLPESVREGKIQGKVYIKFIVSATGYVSNVKVVKGIQDCKECDAEAVRVIKAMPNWTPARNNGKNVHSYFNIPVSFTK